MGKAERKIMMTNLEEQIKLLAELQKLDTQIFKLEEELAAIPESIKKKETEFKEKGSALKKFENEIKALLLKRKEKEGELDAKEGVIKKYQSQLYQLKTNKEYTAMQDEISRAKADNSVIEEDILKLFDQIDIENKKAVKEKEVLNQQESVFAEEKNKMEAEAGRIKAEADRLKAARTELAVKIDKKILSKYERILKNKDGLAMVQIAGSSCQGCFRVMPPQVINEVQLKKDLVFCEYCARILYIEE